MFLENKSFHTIAYKPSFSLWILQDENSFGHCENEEVSTSKEFQINVVVYCSLYRRGNVQCLSSGNQGHHWPDAVLLFLWGTGRGGLGEEVLFGCLFLRESHYVFLASLELTM